jgi:hypothetical protein
MLFYAKVIQKSIKASMKIKEFKENSWKSCALPAYG